MSHTFHWAAVLCLAASGIAQVPTAWRTISEIPVAAGPRAMAHDPIRDRTVFFGGATAGQTLAEEILDETWEFDGTGWVERYPATRPPARWGHAMAFDYSRGTVLMFGGANSTKSFSDTWEWDGLDWKQLTTTAHPTVSKYVGMASDPVRGRIVAFGGWGGFLLPYSDETWEWDGKDWVQQNPAVRPSPRSSAMMTYDPVIGRTVLTGGDVPFGLAGAKEVWSWDGANWTVKSVGLAPSNPRGEVVPDPAGRGILMVAWRNRATQLETWLWDRSAWSLLPTSASSPLGTSVVPMGGAYNSTRRSLVCSGGDVTGVWECDLSTNTWAELVPPRRPRDWTRYFQTVYDPNRDAVIAVGGSYSSQRPPMKTFEYTDEHGFREILTATSPPVRPHNCRLGFGLGHDAVTGNIILFGNTDTTVPDRNTWVFDGKDWTAFALTPSPDPFSHGLFVWDPIALRLLHYAANTELWSFDKTGWTQLHAGSPSSLPTFAGVAFDAKRGRLVVYGPVRLGTNPPELWEWDGVRWTRPNPIHVPSPHPTGELVYSSRLGGVVLVGGGVGCEVGLDSSTWLWDGTDWSDLHAVLPVGTYDPVRRFVYDSAKQRIVGFPQIYPTHRQRNHVVELRIRDLTVDKREAQIGQTLRYDVNSKPDAGNSWLLGLSFETRPGVPVRPAPHSSGYEHVPLKWGLLLQVSLSSGLGGTLDASGKGSFALSIPALPSLIWRELHAVAITVTPGPNLGTITDRVTTLIVR